MDVTKPLRYMGLGTIDATKLYTRKRFGPWMLLNHAHVLVLGPWMSPNHCGFDLWFDFRFSRWVIEQDIIAKPH
jgi:hypothetical protein